jgi:tetratricopeptide (TPR) repeat protein
MMSAVTRLVFVGLVLASAIAFAGPEQEAKALVAKAMKAHEQGDFPTALQNLQAAFDKDPQPELLYAIAQVHVKLSQCKEAIVFYEQFLGTSPSPAAEKDTREAIEICKSQLPPVPAPVVVAPPPPPPPPPPAPALPWYRDAIGAGLVGGGALAATIGIVLYVSARGDLDAAESAANVDAYMDLVDGARTKRVVSVVLVGGGAAMIGYGITRLVMKQPHERDPHLAIVPTTEGGMVTLGGAW